MKKQKIYIAGKISGEPIALCTIKFGTIQKEIEHLGHDAVNPLEVCIADEVTWHEAMRKDIKALMDCDALFALKDYNKSRGAMLEIHIARELEMPIFTSIKDLKRHYKKPLFKISK